MVQKEKSSGEDGRHLVNVYRKNWPKKLREAAHHLV
jgi:hypothetical protein